jgi:hypothetical protein
LCFYLRYIELNKPGILQNRDILPSGWATIMGLQFENLVLNNRQRIQSLLCIPPADIRIDNLYFQRRTKKKAGVQNDYKIQTRFNKLYVCEIKFCKERIGIEIIKEMEQKLNALSLPRGHSVRTVLIHVNVSSKRLKSLNFFHTSLTSVNF